MNDDPKVYSTPHVAVCIATYLRPHGLQNLIESLNRQALEDVLARVTLVICDNAPEATAESILGEIQQLSRWPVIYVVENSRGIVSARNRTLAEVPPDADFIAFLDDDEFASSHWLVQMLETMKLPNTIAVQGPVEPQYTQSVPDWVEELNLFRMGPYEQGKELNSAATNNSMVSAALVHKLGFRFDPRFNLTGGEDEEFFSRVTHEVGTIRAAAEALVWDNVPQHRTSMRWLRRRWFRMGNTLGRIALIRKKGILLRATKGFGAIGWGCLSLVFLGFGSKLRLRRGMLEVFRGSGMIAALLGVIFVEYSADAVQEDRRSDC